MMPADVLFIGVGLVHVPQYSADVTDHRTDALRYRTMGHEFNFVWFNEIANIPPGAYTLLSSRMTREQRQAWLFGSWDVNWDEKETKAELKRKYNKEGKYK